MGDKTRVGRHDGIIQKMLYEKVVLPTITYNMESTTNTINKEMEEMEMIQGKMLRKIYKVPTSTPYWGLLIEMGMKPIEYIIHSKRLILYHNIINTKTKRFSKDIIEQQMTQPTSGGAVTVVSSCCANCVEPPRPQQWGPDLPFFGHAGHADPLDGWRCCSQKRVMSRPIQVRQL